MAVHQRATFINTRIEYIAVNIIPYSQGQLQPSSVMPPDEKQQAQEAMEQYLPNFSDLFGSPDQCECRHCRSVYSPAAYFVDLMRFLSRAGLNESVPEKKSPLDIFKERRPDLFHLPLTCENTNTLIPYIDVANEVMEYYTAYGKLDQDAVHNTGNATAEELRANPQYVNTRAYKTLAAAIPTPDGKNAVYPFDLPYHQPVDVIRTYAKQLGTTRHAIMTALQKETSQSTERAIEAESLELAPEEYLIITRKTYDDVSDTVIEQNFTIEKLQPRDGNHHAVFFTHPREVLTYHYERNPKDPRVQHALTLEVDEFGNVLKEVAIGYGCRTSDSDLTLQVDQDKQTKALITYSENRVITAVLVTNRTTEVCELSQRFSCRS